MQRSSGKPAIFLDRDGTLIEDVDHLVECRRLRLISGAAAAIRRLNERGMPVILVTNQSMIARGMASERQLHEIHQHLASALRAEGAHLDGIYYCPHHPEIGDAPYREACGCRKPLPGLLQKASREHGLDLSRSTMIGDSLRDIEAGDRAGCAALILVRTGHGAAEETVARAAKLTRPIAVYDNLAAAVDGLLAAGPALAVAQAESARGRKEAP